MTTPSLLPRERAVIAPGAVHIPDWLDLGTQQRLVDAAREWGKPPAGLHVVHVRGGVMSVKITCLGWHWLPYRYTRTAEDVDGAPVKPLPGWLADLGRRALGDAYRDLERAAGYRPDAAIVNHYDERAKMGLHQDKDEICDAPVVSFSIGDRCTFRFGNTISRGRPWTDVDLHGGDLFVFGGPSRFAFHGVPRTFAGTGDPATGLADGRINITLRVTGLAD